MNKIITLTVNPTIDKSTSVAGIKPNSKLRCDIPTYEAGGGGINVSKVLNELGANSLCMYLAGGPTGSHLTNLLAESGIPQKIIPIRGRVRENLAVTDTKSDEQYRFGMPGPMLAQEEWQNALNMLEDVLLEGDLLVASGSLCPGMPSDFYAKVSKIANKKRVRFVLDTSGDALLHGARAGAYLLKPNLGELATLCNVKMIYFSELETAAKTFMENHPCEVMVVSLGAQGAMLVTTAMVEYITAPVVYQKSTIGAGDSMVAGMALAISRGKSLSEMAQYGVACGTAATMTEGTQLCKKKDVTELHHWITSNTAPTDRFKINA